MPTAAEAEQGLQAGDYVVYRFSGSFRKPTPTPLTLTQRVLGRDGNVRPLEVVLDEGDEEADAPHPQGLDARGRA